MKSIAIVVSLTAVLCSAQAESLRTQIQSITKATRKLMMARDGKGFEKYMKQVVSPDFRYVENGGSMNFQQMCAGMQMSFAQMKTITKADSTIVSVKEKGNSGVAKMQRTMVGVMQGPDKKPHTMTFAGVSEDSYVKKGGKWKLSKMEWLSNKMLVDGKAIPPMASMPARGQ